MTLKHLDEARELLRRALESYPRANELDAVTVEIVRATASIDRARRVLATGELEAA